MARFCPMLIGLRVCLCVCMCWGWLLVFDRCCVAVCSGLCAVLVGIKNVLIGLIWVVLCGCLCYGFVFWVCFRWGCFRVIFVR